MLTLNLIFIGDWGRNGTSAQRQVAAGMAAVADGSGCHAIVTTGDNFYDHGVIGADDEHWTTSFEDVYTQMSLAVPWYVSLGNHDYQGDPQAQVEYSRRSPRWRCPARYYLQTLSIDPSWAVDLIMLDTTPLLSMYQPGGACFLEATLETDPAGQLKWLEDTLRGSSARWKLVVGHHPVFSGSPFHGSSPELEHLLRPLFVRYGVHAYVCGHEHDLQHLRSDGVDHFVSGSASDLRETGDLEETRFSYSGLGFLSAAVSADEIRFRFHDESGNVLYEAADRGDRSVPARSSPVSRHRAA